MKLLTFFSFIITFGVTQAQVRIVKVVPSTNTITIKNFGSSPVDISSYRLCTLIRYTSNLTTGISINSGSMNLAAGAEVEFVAPAGASGSWPNLSSEADLGLYLATGSFGSASAMVDFTQWGSAGHGRESVAVSKGIWSAGEFVSGNEPYSYIGNGTQNGASFWEGTTSSNNTPTDISLAGSSIDENQDSGTQIGTLSTTDADGGDTHTYSLVTGTGDTDNASFSISGSTLNSAAVFNFEVKSSLSIRIQTDDANGGTFEKVFTITVNDLSESPTGVSLSSNDIPTGSTAGFEVGTLSTEDEDANESFTYSLISGTGDDNNALFRLDDNKLLLDVDLTTETSPLSIRVQSTDKDQLSIEQQLSITIGDPPLGLSGSQLKIYPNPVHEVLFIENHMVKEPLQFELSNLSGQNMSLDKISAEAGKSSIDTSELPSGIYLLRIKALELTETMVIIKD